MDRNEDIKRSWDKNAKLWTMAVRERRIPSRTKGTDQAIVDAVERLKPRRVVDIGCGEGWLVRRLSRDLGCDITGTDGSAPLIDDALAAHENGTYFVLTYAQLTARPDLLVGPYDVAICNFSLLGEDISSTLKAVKTSLARDGSLLIQTLHPWAVCGENEYADGWRNETFAAFETGNWVPMPWFFRTMSSWFGEIEAAGMRVMAIQEPADPVTQRPLSVLFRCVSMER